MKEGKEGAVKEEGVVARHFEAKMRTRRKMKMWIQTKTRGMRVSTTPMINDEEGLIGELTVKKGFPMWMMHSHHI